MKYYSALLFLFLFLSSCTNNQYTPDQFHSDRAKEANRDEFLENIKINTIEDALNKKLTHSTEAEWQGAFWAMQLIQYKPDKFKEKINFAFNSPSPLSDNFYRSLLEVVFSLCPDDFLNEVNQFAEKTKNPKLFSMAVLYIHRIDPARSKELVTKEKLIVKFGDFIFNPILSSLLEHLSGKKKTHPPVTDLLAARYIPELPVIFSFQSKNREYPGITVIRDKYGKFMRDKNRKIFHIRHLALAVTGLPFFITNGNTPQGIFSISGIDFSDNKFIGPVPNIQLRMPFETGPADFLHDSLFSGEWTEELYRDLLPTSWKDYNPVYQSWFAGKAGRSEIIAHGTTINPEFYAGEKYYPFTPSLGCLTAKEIWDKKSGALLESGQIKLVNKLLETEETKGLLILIDLDTGNNPVEYGDIEKYILSAEKIFRNEI